MDRNIGELKPVPVREAWPDEARHLTPWLADNPEALSRALGMDLELDGSEVAVGPFKAHLLLHDANTGKSVVVENMIGKRTTIIYPEEVDVHTREQWEVLRDWTLEHIGRFKDAVQPHINRLG